MKSYFLLAVLFGIISFIAVVFLIIGIIKKQKNIFTVAAIFLAVGVGGCAYAIIAYTREAYHYVTGKDFQNDVQKGAGLVGQTLGSASSGFSKGISETLDDNAIRTLAGKSASIIGNSIKTIASGLDSALGNKQIFIDTSLSASHLELGRASATYDGNANDIDIFIQYPKGFKGKLKLTNYDQTGKKIDIAQKAVDAKTGQETVEQFQFLHSDLGLTTYYILSKTE